MTEPDNNQMAFWEAMKEKYERRNESLKHQEKCLRKRLEQLKQIMESQKVGNDCDCVPEKLEKQSLVQCLVEKGKSLILGTCKCGDPKIGEELLCACHIQDSNVPLNVDPNLCPMQEPFSPEGCLNTTCDFYDPTLAHLVENPSTFSLKTTDIYYMDKLADLVKAEKNMQGKINDLAEREHSYLTAIHDMQETMKKEARTAPINQEFKKLIENLEEDNKKLRNELEDLRLELKHCFERVEGPLRRSLEDQRDKCSKLENQLKDLQVKTKFKEDSYLREINEVKAKLCQTCCTMVDLNNVNSKLKDDLSSLQNNCMNLEDELLKQQLKEAENILKFKNALSRRSPEKRIQNKGDDSEQDLAHIAKKLGDTLKEVCPCVSDVPSGLTETAENIRKLTEMVGEKGEQQRKKRKGKMLQITTSSCSDVGDVKAPAPSTEFKKETKDCACSNSSLRLKPMIGQNYIENKNQAQNKNSSSTSLATKPKLKMKATKQTCTLKSGDSMKKTLSKGCTCCPAQNECDHGPSSIRKESTETLCDCSDIDTKKTGPSEEVLAVKNLGTLSMPPGETLIETKVADIALTSKSPKIKDEQNIKLKRNKLAVDTTCDVLDKPPEDIHVVTTIANTGSLEITTEGPPGIIETKVNYLPDGKIEIVTKLINRHNMENFLDGTLLQFPESSPDYVPNQSYTRQYDARTTFAEEGCFEIDCNQSKTCGGLCDNEAEETVVVKGEANQQNLVSKVEMRMAEEVNKKIPYGQVVVNNNFILIGGTDANPFMNSWKNIKFNDDSEERTALLDMVFLAKPKGNRHKRTLVHTDVTSEAEMLRLASRQSFTNVEKFMKEDNMMKSTSSFIFPDVLDTISEEDEELSDSCKGNRLDKVTEEKEINNLEDSSEETIVQTEPPVVVDEMSNISEVSKLNGNAKTSQNEPEQFPPRVIPKDGDIRTTASTETVKNFNSQHMIQMSDTISFREQNDFEIKLDEQASAGLPETEKSSQQSLTSSRSATTFDGISEIHSECRIAESILKLPQNINIFNGKITLKQSKSMYEKKGSRSEYLRICKSATLSLGSLKIDLERLKLSQKIWNVGDFSEFRTDNKSRILVENIPIVTIPVNGSKGSPCIGTNEKISLDVLKEGCSNPFQTYQSISKQTYQCYVCSCSKQKDKNDDQEGKNVQQQNNQDLAERIDRLLKIDPLSPCKCVDCLVPNVQKENAKGSREKCKCLRKQEDKADPSRQRCRCNGGKKRSTPKLEGPKQQGDNVQHGENCTCVDCICNPCHFKKNVTACDCKKCECDPCCAKDNHLNSIIAFEMNKPLQEIMVMNVTIPCDCSGKCSCSPCMDESKKPRSFSREQTQSKTQPQVKSYQKGIAQETSCKRCANKIPEAQTEEPKNTKVAVDSSRAKKEFQVGSPVTTLPDTWKNVVGCSCSPPFDEKKAVCDCKPCECKPCGYQEKARKPCDCKPSKSESKTYGPSGKCNCETCPSENCNNSSVGAIKNYIDKDLGFRSSLLNCHCQLCECLFCSDPNARKKSPVTPLNILEKHTTKEENVSNAVKNMPLDSQQDVCVCAKCMCDPCVVLADQKGDTDGTKCNCNKCECNPCFDTNLLVAGNLKTILHPNDMIEERKTVKTDKIVSCDCGTCECLDCVAKHKQSSLNDKNRGNESDNNVMTSKNQSNESKKHKCPCGMKFDTNEPVDCNNCFICAEEVIDEKRMDEKPAIDKPIEEKPVAEKTIDEKRIAEKPIDEKRTDEKRIDEKPIGEKRINKKPIDEKRIYEKSIDEKPIDEKPIDEKPIDEKPIDEKPIDEKPLDERSIDQKFIDEKPVDEKFTDKELIDDKPVGKKLTDKKPINEDVSSEIPCDCNKPCICCFCPDPKVRKYKLPQMIGDADRAKEEIKNVLNKICCTCNQAEDNLKPLVKKASNFETTISKMKMKLNNLQQKCKDKDQIIDAMTTELRIRSQSGIFEDLLYDLAHPKEKVTPDFTRTYVCDFLPKPRHKIGTKLQSKRGPQYRYDNMLEPILEIDRYLPGFEHDTYGYSKNLDVSGMEITDIRRVTIDSILIKWRGPPRLNGITGYQIFVNEELKYRVLSPNRTNAVIDSLDLSSSLEIMLFAITSYGRCEPPALATYKI